jgi:hypothetical protein
MENGKSKRNNSLELVAKANNQASLRFLSSSDFFIEEFNRGNR